MVRLLGVSDNCLSMLRTLFSFLVLPFTGALYYFQTFFVWLFGASGEKHLKKARENASTYEEWAEASSELDERSKRISAWKKQVSSPFYDFKVIYERLKAISAAADKDDLDRFRHILQTGAARNFGKLMDSRLFQCSYMGTKHLVERYIEDMVGVVDIIANDPRGRPRRATLEVLEASRLSIGRSALVLQGGSMFAMCHVGIMKALYLRNLLPRIIIGTATGALMAALVAVRTDHELDVMLRGDGLDLSAFINSDTEDGQPNQEWYDELKDRVVRYFTTGYLLEHKALEQFVETNVGDMTFDEAYCRTGREVTILTSSDAPGTPNCLNRYTAPNVLIRSAALASSINNPTIDPDRILEKDGHSNLVPWILNRETPAFREKRRRMESESRSGWPKKAPPLEQVQILYNIKHFIISQARPHLIPLLLPLQHRSNTPQRNRRISAFWNGLVRFIISEVQFQLRLLDMLGWMPLPHGLSRYVRDEQIPTLHHITIVPEIGWYDLYRLLRNPTQDEIKWWILRGEKSVWPAVTELQVRCAMEKALERGVEDAKRNGAVPFPLDPAITQ